MPREYYTDLRNFLEALDQRGKLYRWSRPVDKDSELMPLMRLQYRGRADEARQAFLFENVTDAKAGRYDMKVLTGMYGSSRSIIGLGMGCEDPQGIYEKWRHAVTHPIAPVVVERGKVQEEVHTGAELE